MKNKVKRKKGSSLIEVIISITILALVIIPISNIVINAVKTSKMSERKQIASFEGQKLLEEFKSYNHIDTVGGKFKLLNGEEMEETSTGKYEKTIPLTRGNQNYELNITMEKDDAFKNSGKANNYAASFSLLSDEKKLTFKDGITGAQETKQFQGNKIIFQVESNAQSITVIYINSNGDEEEVENYPVSALSVTNKPLIYVGETFIQSMDFEVRNLAPTKVIFDTIVKQSENQTTRGNINTYSIGAKSNLVMTGEAETEQGDEVLAGEIIGDLYKIKVQVKYKNEIYYTSSVAQNIEVI